MDIVKGAGWAAAWTGWSAGNLLYTFANIFIKWEEFGVFYIVLTVMWILLLVWNAILWRKWLKMGEKYGLKTAADHYLEGRR